MIVALSLLLVGLVAVLVISHLLEGAPVGFEDDRGFHALVGQPQKPSKAVSPAMKTAHEVVG